MNAPLNQMDEAEMRVLYRRFLAEHGQRELLQCVYTMQQCCTIALEVVREDLVAKLAGGR